MSATALVRVSQVELIVDHIGLWRRLEHEARREGGRVATIDGTGMDTTELFAFGDQAAAQRFADEARGYAGQVCRVDGP